MEKEIEEFSADELFAELEEIYNQKTLQPGEVTTTMFIEHLEERGHKDVIYQRAQKILEDMVKEGAWAKRKIAGGQNAYRKVT